MGTTEIIAIVVVVVVGVIYITLQGAKEDKIANKGEEKNKIDDIVRAKIKNSGNYTTVFAYWDEKQFSGTGSRLNIKTTSWNFAMCFNFTEVFLIPLQITENDILGDEPIHLDSENLSLVNGKDGQIWVSFYDKNGEDIVTLFVERQLRKSNDRYVNLNQDEEFDKFIAWLPTFMDTVNTKNGTTPSNKILKK